MKIDETDSGFNITCENENDKDKVRQVLTFMVGETPSLFELAFRKSHDEIMQYANERKAV